MKRILLLCFIHGFKGNDFTFGDFPAHLKEAVANKLPDHDVATVVYPKYETRGELAQCTAAFLEWLKERVMELRKEHLDTPWPPTDRKVGVILVAHSMGGFVATDALFQILDSRHQTNSSGPIFPLIQGILAFDTPLNGLSRTMFLHGAVTHYQKLSSALNLLTALSAATPAALSRLAPRRPLSTTTTTTTTTANPWQPWYLLALRTGAVGALAAGGAAAFTHRKHLLAGARHIRTHLARSSPNPSPNPGVPPGASLGVSRALAWLTGHIAFVGALLRPRALRRRLARLAAVRGVGVRVVYASLGESGGAGGGGGYWSGGLWFVPWERTFCAVPAAGAPARGLFVRHVVPGARDEVAAHVGLFRRRGGEEGGYGRMVGEAAEVVVEWFAEEGEVVDGLADAELPPVEEEVTTEAIAEAVEEGDIAPVAEEDVEVDIEHVLQADVEMADGGGVLGEASVDIAAAAALVPLPDDIDEDLSENAGKAEQQAYLRRVFGAAAQTGTGLRSYLPSLPAVEMPRVSMPAMPAMPRLPNMPSMRVPRVNPFAKKSTVDPTPAGESGEGVELSKGDGGVDGGENRVPGGVGA